MRIIIFTLLCLWVAPVIADQLIAREHNDRQYRYEDRQYSRVPERQDQDPTKQILGILIDQGIAGVGLIFLGWFIWKTNGQARQDRRELEGRLITLIEKTNTSLTEQKDHLENIGRELERLR